jgi:hypothetical protein
MNKNTLVSEELVDDRFNIYSGFVISKELAAKLYPHLDIWMFVYFVAQIYQ